MADAIPAQEAPCPAAVEAGKVYFRCAFGRSKTQPFCGGKASANKPQYDGSHNRL